MVATKEKTVNEVEEPKKNDYCRKIMISGYRNIGVDRPAFMTINRSLDKDRLGGLSIIVGPNNSGKSNVLDAIESLDKGIMKSDTPDFFSIEFEGEPVVELVVFDDGKIHVEKKKTKKKETKKKYNISGYKKEELLEQANLFLRDLKFSNDPKLEQAYRPLSSRIDLLYPITSYSEEKISTVIDIARRIPKNLLNFVFSSGQYPILEDLVELEGSLEDEPVVEDEPKEESFEDKYGFSPNPTIIRYKEEPIHQSDLKSSIKPFNKFMQNVLGMTFNNQGVKKVADAYDRFEKGGNSGFLTMTEKKLQEEAKLFSERFNDLYYTDGIPYSFNIRMMEETITLEMYMGDEPLDLDRQSTGFKWFFNFFFNFLCSRALKPGDIVIMDEPATNLHPSGQIELREFIRKFAINTGVSFIISTHSPFLIDCDYLDEVRIVTRLEDGSSTIYDKFTIVDTENPDQMDQILRSLTIGRHVLMDPNDRMYFVEGITDYNYLTAFKILFGIKGISFMPVNGLGGETDKAHREKIISSLMKIDRAPTLIVDGDGAGKEMKEMSENTGLEVISIKDIDARFHTIESLFKKEDRDKFIPVKEWHASSIFKQYIDEIGPMLSDYTIENFRKLFKTLEI